MLSPLPPEVILETTNICNLQCVMCHFHGIGARKVRESGKMPRELWEKVIAELAKSDAPHTLITHGAGEPLLYPELFELIHTAKKHANLSVGFMSNGMLLTPEVAREIVHVGVDWLAFSIDGVEPEPHARYRKNSDLAVIEKNVFNLIAEKQKLDSNTPKLMFNMVCLPEIAGQELEYVRKWLPHAESVMISRYRPVGSKRLAPSLMPNKRTPCQNINRQLVIGWDGRVALCCEDIHCDVMLGNINTQSVHDIWNGKALGEIRERHYTGQASTIPLCAECDTWASEFINEKSSMEGGIEKIVTPAHTIYRKT